MNNKVKQAKYSLDFKQDAANLVMEKEYTCQQAAASLGVPLNAIRRWVKAEKGALSPAGSEQASLSLAEREELIRLRKECNGQVKPETFLRDLD